MTLPGRPGWEELVERSRPGMEEISSVFESFTPSDNEAQSEEDLVRPVLNRPAAYALLLSKEI